MTTLAPVVRCAACMNVPTYDLATYGPLKPSGLPKKLPHPSLDQLAKGTTQTEIRQLFAAYAAWAQFGHGQTFLNEFNAGAGNGGKLLAPNFAHWAMQMGCDLSVLPDTDPVALAAKEQEKKKNIDTIRQTSISDIAALDLSARQLNALNNQNVITVQQLLDAEPTSLEVKYLLTKATLQKMRLTLRGMGFTKEPFVVGSEED